MNFTSLVSLCAMHVRHFKHFDLNILFNGSPEIPVDLKVVDAITLIHEDGRFATYNRESTVDELITAAVECQGRVTAAVQRTYPVYPHLGADFLRDTLKVFDSAIDAMSPPILVHIITVHASSTDVPGTYNLHALQHVCSNTEADRLNQSEDPYDRKLDSDMAAWSQKQYLRRVYDLNLFGRVSDPEEESKKTYSELERRLLATLRDLDQLHRVNDALKAEIASLKAEIEDARLESLEERE